MTVEKKKNRLKTGYNCYYTIILFRKPQEFIESGETNRIEHKNNMKSLLVELYNKHIWCNFEENRREIKYKTNHNSIFNIPLT
ncbi:MAG: hypothetical protein ACI90V_010158 [Bacillariaceae sp.]|jgi:hypothetical protein